MGEEYYQKIFSENLKYFMEINNKSQVDIINDLGFDKSAVSTWCNGTRLPRMDKVDALAKYFHIKRSELIEEMVPDNSSTSSISPKLSLDQEEVRIILAYRNSDYFTRELVRRALGIFTQEQATDEN
ncbi:MAG: helix-turn-helix transcriptional regulator [Lachnospiraceae bacterium]|nr:helix-turn-helix transcriptional regulator [Lachnospiraceae bacterium]